jgi:hypothetical protein
MSQWGNTDAASDKPLFPYERQVRPFSFSLTTANLTQTGATTIVFNGGATNLINAQSLGIRAGMFVYAANVSITGEKEYFTANNSVASVSGNNVVLANAVFGNVASGLILDFGTSIVYNSNTANTYNQDTIMVTPGRLANSSFGNTARSSAVAHAGWVYTTTGTGGRAGRVQTEVLVALANTSASNTGSGNTSNSQTYYSSV